MLETQLCSTEGALAAECSQPSWLLTWAVAGGGSSADGGGGGGDGKDYALTAAWPPQMVFLNTTMTLGKLPVFYVQ